jgi:RNA polymerase sigma-70 factor (ECF subfamily)
LATERELSDFLASVEKRAFKRTVYHVREEESALDIVQDSMMKLAEHYGDKPPNELPMLFQRILSNCTLDWFRRQKTRNALFSNLSDFESASDEGDFDLLETYSSPEQSQQVESAEDATRRAQVLREIEGEIMELPARQREAFLMRYWEDMDVAETAAAMGCSEGSVKTHCSRAVAALSKALKAKGIQLGPPPTHCAPPRRPTSSAARSPCALPAAPTSCPTKCGSACAPPACAPSLPASCPKSPRSSSAVAAPPRLPANRPGSTASPPSCRCWCWPPAWY